MQRAAAGIVGKCGDAGLQFVYYIDELAIWMKGEVTRAGSGIELGIGRIVQGEGSGFCVEAIDQQLIKAQINCDCETIVGGSFDPVRVRTFLALAVDARPDVLNES